MKSIFSLPILLLFLTLTFDLFGQNYCLNRRNFWLTYAAGPSYTQFKSVPALGAIAQIGTLKEGSNKRFRISPLLNIGAYTTYPFSSERQSWYNTLDLQLVFYYDLVKFRHSSIVGGVSPDLYALLGLTGSGGNPYVAESQYLKSVGAGVRGMLGLHLTPHKKKYTIDILPLNVFAGTGLRTDFYATLNLNVQLRSW